jgi:hypothetical protein
MKILVICGASLDTLVMEGWEGYPYFRFEGLVLAG